ncbi:MAG: sulfite exporter TauE/SafE family protein [Thermoplasmata archaeon]|nr:sulfite exporter TauE/SafE family protein [Thermoplasmata archaeon]
MIPINNLWLALLAFGAAIINGAVGYGFSSTVTPIAILWYSNKVLNPALVIVEVVVNIALLTRERKHISATWARARPVVLTLLPGVILGTIGLAYLAVNDVKVVVYVVLFPLIILQLWGYYRPFKNERRSAAAVGPGIGFLYSLTTISGPPLALFLRNQGMSKNEFRCTIAQIRVAESSLTLATYFAFDGLLGTNLISFPAVSLLPYLFIPVLIGVPLGTLLLGAVSPEFFRRFVMSVDGIFVSYGLSRVIIALKWVTTDQGNFILGVLLLLVAILSWVSLNRVVRQSLPLPGGPGGPGTLAGPSTTRAAASMDGSQPAGDSFSGT